MHPPPKTFSGATVMDHLHQHGISLLTDYQPSDRFWTFQLIEAALFFGLAICLVTAGLWWLHRRAWPPLKGKAERGTIGSLWPVTPESGFYQRRPSSAMVSKNNNDSRKKLEIRTPVHRPITVVGAHVSRVVWVVEDLDRLSHDIRTWIATGARLHGEALAILSLEMDNRNQNRLRVTLVTPLLGIQIGHRSRYAAGPLEEAALTAPSERDAARRDQRQRHQDTEEDSRWNHLPRTTSCESKACWRNGRFRWPAALPPDPVLPRRPSPEDRADLGTLWTGRHRPLPSVGNYGSGEVDVLQGGEWSG